ncbi:STAS domain-containing protein [Amycolatopsis sp. CA-230715]|uniref:STAS domain-containing protein n=1 Tax=Amycolatopsis sp. CA-230715 TaxID=2745196 RepID=UPI001C021F07|nr:STAS domain-containing protein [Amycolatopsis sp. CA-230715]QWF86066.1 hypothetical protein HUW46_09547 [Amycolatopsis sp. CA-230715]
MTEVPAPRAPHAVVPPPAPFGVRVVRPTHTATIVEVTGDLDRTTVRHFLDVLEPRLASVVSTVVVDLSEAALPDAAGLAALRRCAGRASATGQAFLLITGPHCACRALETGQFACRPARTAEPVA